MIVTDAFAVFAPSTTSTLSTVARTDFGSSAARTRVSTGFAESGESVAFAAAVRSPRANARRNAVATSSGAGSEPNRPQPASGTVRTTVRARTAARRETRTSASMPEDQNRTVAY